MRPHARARGASTQTGDRRSGNGTSTGAGKTAVSRSGASSTALVTSGDAHTCSLAPVIIMTLSTRAMTRTNTLSP